jgi:hypothetical protein
MQSFLHRFCVNSGRPLAKAMFLLPFALILVLRPSISCAAANPEPAEEQMWIEAESGVFGAPMQPAVDQSASSGRFIWVPEGRGDNYGMSVSGGSATYRFQTAKTGDYRIWGLALAGGDRSDSFFVGVDSGRYVRWDVARAREWSWNVAATVFLTAGTHTLRILNREDGAKLDRILITSDPNYTPTGLGGIEAPPPAPSQAPAPLAPASPPRSTAAPAPPPAADRIWIEAESGSLQPPMRSAAEAAASSGAYIWVPEGDWENYSMYERGGSADYRFQVSKPGGYRIWGRILAGGDQSDSFFIAVDSGYYARWDVPHAREWSWDFFATTIHLTAGEHTLRILNREDGTKLDRILVTDDMTFTPK